MAVLLWWLYDVPKAALAFSANVLLAMLFLVKYPEWFALELCI
jgi:hypothetical protein